VRTALNREPLRQARAQELVERVRDLLALCDGEARDLTDHEARQVREWLDEADAPGRRDRRAAR
jgi:hypothetical protein